MKKTEEEKEGVRKVTSFERNKLMQRNEIDLDQFISSLGFFLILIERGVPCKLSFPSFPLSTTRALRKICLDCRLWMLRGGHGRVVYPIC